MSLRILLRVPNQRVQPKEERTSCPCKEATLSFRRGNNKASPFEPNDQYPVPVYKRQPCLPSLSTHSSFKLTRETIRFTMSALKASENFEPSSEWVDEEAFRTLLVHLPGFKREQIKAQITNTGHLNVSGERPLEGQRWSKFTEQYPLPEHCKVEETRAKFENETLYVRFSIDQDEVAMHKSPSSSPMEKTTTELGEKAQERNGKSQKAAPDGEKAAPEEQKLQRKQKQLEAKKEIDRNEQPKATGTQEKKHGTLQDKERSEEGKLPKATGTQEKKHETLQDKERSEEGKQPKATGTQEKKHETLQDKERSEEGKQPKATGTQEKKHETLQDKEISEGGKQPKATSNQEKKHETLQDKERSEEGLSNIDKIQGQQMSPALETDDTSSLAKAPYSTISLFMGLSPAKKTLLVNVAVAGLVLLGIGLYLTYKYGDN